MHSKFRRQSEQNLVAVQRVGEIVAGADQRQPTGLVALENLIDLQRGDDASFGQRLVSTKVLL